MLKLLMNNQEQAVSFIKMYIHVRLIIYVNYFLTISATQSKKIKANQNYISFVKYQWTYKEQKKTTHDNQQKLKIN